MKRYIIFHIAILLALQAGFSQTDTDIYSTGFYAEELFDLSRSVNTANKDLGKEDSLITNRSITIAMWYPAYPTESDTKMSFGDYFSLMEIEEKKDLGFAEYYNLSEEEEKRIQGLKTNSFSGSAFPDEEFPLVIYIPGLNGFSFDNHMLCESIARKGYVVISFNSKGTESRWMNIANTDFENMIRDIQFIIGESGKFPMISNENVTLIGHSIGGHLNILTKMRDSRIGSLVSLDGSIKHDYKRTSDFIFNDYRKINCPFLSISNKNLEDARIYLDSMKNADRYYFKTSGFSHKDYKSLTYILKNDYKSARYNNYLLLNDLAVSFVEMVNGNDAGNSFENLTNELADNSFLEYNFLESVPDIDDFKVLMGRDDFTGLKTLYENMKNEYPGFTIPENDLVAWGNRLRYLELQREAVEVYELIIYLNPDNQSVKNKLTRMTAE